MKKLLTIMISIMVLSLSFSLKSQVDRAGTIIKINGNEITVRNENPSEPFVMGETLRLLTGDKSVVLQVTFAMQSSAKCKIISGKIGSLKIGSLVYSGRISETSGGNEVKTIEKSKVKSMKIDDFETFLGLSQGDTMDKAVQILGKPTEIAKEDRLDITIDYFWNNEENCYITVYSQSYRGKRNIVGSISISSSFYKFDQNINKSFYIDTTNQGTVHYLHSRGVKDSALDLFGVSAQDIINIFGNTKETTLSNDNTFKYTYKTSNGRKVIFSFYTSEDKLESITVYFKS